MTKPSLTGDVAQIIFGAQTALTERMAELLLELTSNVLENDREEALTTIRDAMLNNHDMRKLINRMREGDIDAARAFAETLSEQLKE